MADIANFIAQNSPRFNRAAVDREHYGNALMQNQVARIPQANRAQDLEIQRYEQVTNESKQANARKFLGDAFSSLAQSQDPINLGRSIIGNPSFQAALRDVGMDPAQFTIDQTDTAESLQRQSMDLARLMGAQDAAQDRYSVEEGPDGSKFSVNNATGQRSTLLGRAPQEPTPSAGPQPPSGYRFRQDGTLEFVPGGPADPSRPQPTAPARPTEGDKRNGLMFDSMVNAETQLVGLGLAGNTTDTSSKWDALLGLSGLGVAQSDAYKQYEAAGLRWAANSLYMKSGATATPEEIRSTWKQFFPQPGDGPQVIQQKNAARVQEMQSAGTAVGREVPAGLLNQAQGQGTPAPEGTVVTSQDGRTMVKRNGQWVPQ